MELAFHRSGAGQPLVILHGLYGSSDNWHTAGRILSASFEVFLVDLRNHGKSPHNPEHTYDAMREDLYGFFLSHNIENAILVGHSMGGKTAMSFSFKYGRLIEKLVVVDISPLPYNTENYNVFSIHERIISALQQTDPALITSREEADRMLSTAIPWKHIRQFLLKNLKRKDHGKFAWSLNIEAVASNLGNIMAGVWPEESAIPVQMETLFIKGENSRYIVEKDINAINSVFSNVILTTIPGAGHWVHAEQPELFMDTLCRFLKC